MVEWLLLAGLALLFSSSFASIFWIAWRAEVRKVRFADEVAARTAWRIDGVKSGDLARPLELVVVDESGAVYTCTAVVRGDEPLWHIEARDLALPVERVCVVVDKQYKAWSREARGLVLVENRALGARLLALAEGAAPPVLDVEALAPILDGPRRPIATVVEPQRVFVEARRTKELVVEDLERAVAITAAVVAVARGETPPPVPAAPPLLEEHTVQQAPSGSPVLIPAR